MLSPNWPIKPCIEPTGRHPPEKIGYVKVVQSPSTWVLD